MDSFLLQRRGTREIRSSAVGSTLLGTRNGVAVLKRTFSPAQKPFNSQTGRTPLRGPKSGRTSGGRESSRSTVRTPICAGRRGTRRSPRLGSNRRRPEAASSSVRAYVPGRGWRYWTPTARSSGGSTGTTTYSVHRGGSGRATTSWVRTMDPFKYDSSLRTARYGGHTATMSPIGRWSTGRSTMPSPMPERFSSSFQGRKCLRRSDSIRRERCSLSGAMGSRGTRSRSPLP